MVTNGLIQIILMHTSNNMIQQNYTFEQSKHLTNQISTSNCYMSMEATQNCIINHKKNI